MSFLTVHILKSYFRVIFVLFPKRKQKVFYVIYVDEKFQGVVVSRFRTNTFPSKVQ